MKNTYNNRFYQSNSHNSEKEIKNLRAQLAEKTAELENFKNRTKIEKENLKKYSSEKFMLELIHIMDDFDRLSIFIKDNNGITDSNKINDGIMLIYEQMDYLLEKNGIKKFNSKYKPFDVNLHNAVYKETNLNYPSNIILKEIKPGYTYHDKVIRHAEVVVNDNNIDNN